MDSLQNEYGKNKATTAAKLAKSELDQNTHIYNSNMSNGCIWSNWNSIARSFKEVLLAESISSSSQRQSHIINNTNTPLYDNNVVLLDDYIPLHKEDVTSDNQVQPSNDDNNKTSSNHRLYCPHRNSEVASKSTRCIYDCESCVDDVNVNLNLCDSNINAAIISNNHDLVSTALNKLDDSGILLFVSNSATSGYMITLEQSIKFSLDNPPVPGILEDTIDFDSKEENPKNHFSISVTASNGELYYTEDTYVHPKVIKRLIQYKVNEMSLISSVLPKEFNDRSASVVKVKQNTNSPDLYLIISFDENQTVIKATNLYPNTTKLHPNN